MTGTEIAGTETGTGAATMTGTGAAATTGTGGGAGSATTQRSERPRSPCGTSSVRTRGPQSRRRQRPHQATACRQALGVTPPPPQQAGTQGTVSRRPQLMARRLRASTRPRTGSRPRRLGTARIRHHRGATEPTRHPHSRVGDVACQGAKAVASVRRTRGKWYCRFTGCFNLVQVQGGALCLQDSAGSVRQDL